MSLITAFFQEDSPFCLTRAITRTMIGPRHTMLSLAARDEFKHFLGAIVMVGFTVLASTKLRQD